MPLLNSTGTADDLGQLAIGKTVKNLTKRLNAWVKTGVHFLVLSDCPVAYSVVRMTMCLSAQRKHGAPFVLYIFCCTYT